jgi:hypothetical protein
MVDPGTLRYVGTPGAYWSDQRRQGSAGVDGVTLVPIIDSARPALVELVINAVIPLVASPTESQLWRFCDVWASRSSSPSETVLQ